MVTSTDSGRSGVPESRLKVTPPAAHLIQAIEGAKTLGEVRQAVMSLRYAGDVKQMAERMGLHYLKSKRMRTRELRQWIINNHQKAEES